mgnify:CR=1 FL=1
MEKRKVIFRADASPLIGMGHFYRTLALCDMLVSNFNCIFATIVQNEEQKEIIQKFCNDLIELSEATHFDDFLKVLSGNEIIVLDNYYFNTKYQTSIKAKGCKLVCIDDIYDKHYVADIVINHAPLSPYNYSTSVYTQLKIGFEYALLRKEFYTFLPKHNDGNFQHGLICMGGADIKNLTLNILKELSKVEYVKKISIVVGANYKYLNILKEAVIYEQSFYKKELHLHVSIGAGIMRQIINEIDFAIVPSSTVLLEVISQNKPVITGYYVKNQKEISNYLYNKYPQIQVVGDLQNISLLEKHIHLLRTNIEKINQPDDNKLLDGKSPERLLKIFKNLDVEFRITIRPSQEKDVDIYYSWVNEYAVRRFSINRQPIKYEQHQTWFTKKLAEHNTFMYVLETDNNMIGQVRFDKEDNLIFIDFSIDKSFRGKGYGTTILKLALEEINKNKVFKKTKILIGKVNALNIASCKVFNNLNFMLSDKERHNDEIFNVYKKDIL